MADKFPKKLKIAIYLSDEPSTLEFLDVLQKVLNFSYEPIWFNATTFGMKLKNGSWTGILEAIQRGECDIITNLKEEIMEIMDFSFPYLFSDMTFITSKPTKLQRTFAFIDAFSVQLWIAVLVFYIFFSLMVHRFLHCKESYFDLMMNLFGSLLGQSFTFKFRRTSKRFLFISWIIGVFLLSQTFRNVLLSFWSVPSVSGIRNIQELADAVKKGHYIVRTEKDHPLIKTFLESTSENMIIIGNSMLQHNDNNLERHEFLQKYKSAFVFLRRPLLRERYQYFLSEDSFMYFSAGLAIRKGFCCLEKLNKVILRLLETGVIEKIFSRDYQMMYEVKYKFVPIEESEQERPLNLQDISGAFYILLCGYALSLIAFIAEIFIYMKNNRSKRMRQ